MTENGAITWTTEKGSDFDYEAYCQWRRETWRELCEMDKEDQRALMGAWKYGIIDNVGLTVTIPAGARNDN